MKTYHNTGMVATFNPIENAWLSAHRHFNESGDVKLLAWPQPLNDAVMQVSKMEISDI